MRDPRATWAGRTAGRLGGAVYDFAVERERLARPAARLLWGSDAGLLFDSIRTIGMLPAGSAVLDVPCGGGVAFRGLRPDQGIRYVAADISPAMLDRARLRARREGLGWVEFVPADVERMPFDDGEFDVCVTFNGLHCLPDPAAAVWEMARCLRAGGRLIGDTVIRGAGRRYDLLIAAFQRAGFFGAGGATSDLRRWLAAAGLDVHRLERSGAVAHFTAVK